MATEPIAPDTNPVFVAPPAAKKPTLESAMGPFAHTQFRFTTGLRAGEVAHVWGASGDVLLTYRSFATVAGVVAALVSAIVAFAGIGAVLLLLREQAPVRAAIAAGLTIAFTCVIAMLAPRTSVTLYDGEQPALMIAQRTAFPSASFVVAAPNSAQIAELRKSPLARLGRNRWTILHGGRYIGEAAEESLGRALLRKVAGKFSRRFESDVRITHGRVETARIIRRPDATARVDMLEVTSDALDRRVLVALATLILGGEP